MATSKQRRTGVCDSANAARIRDEFQYLLVTPRDRQWGLFVTAAGEQFIAPHARFRTKGHSPLHDYTWDRGRVMREYSIVYLIRGRGEFESEQTGLKKIGPGSVIRLFPNVWHRYRPIEEIGFDSYWVMFQGGYAEQLHKQGFWTAEQPIVETGMDELISRPFISLLDHVRSQPPGFQQLLAADMLAILAGIQSAAYRQQTQDHVQEIVRRARLKMETSDELPDVDAIADESGLCRTHFYQAFKDCTGASPYQYHLQFRMSRARQLLRGSSLSIEQIAATLKFNSVYHFSKLFKKKTGFCPSRYRRGG